MTTPLQRRGCNIKSVLKSTWISCPLKVSSPRDGCGNYFCITITPPHPTTNVKWLTSQLPRLRLLTPVLIKSFPLYVVVTIMLKQKHWPHFWHEDSKDSIKGYLDSSSLFTNLVLHARENLSLYFSLRILKNLFGFVNLPTFDLN